MVRAALVIAVFLPVFYANAYEVPLTPDPELTSGDFCTPEDRDFMEYRYEERVPTCFRAVSRHVKKRIYEAYGIPEKCRSQYTVDHFIPLFMGGSNHPQNLWPEHVDIKATRQNLEQQIYLQLANGTISHRSAVEAVVDAKLNPPPVKPRGCRKKIRYSPHINLGQDGNTDQNSVVPEMP